MPKVDLPRPPDPQLDPAGYLRCLPAVRERSRIVYEKSLRNELNHFDVDMSKMDDVVRFVSGLIKVCSFPSELEALVDVDLGISPPVTTCISTL